MIYCALFSILDIGTIHFIIKRADIHYTFNLPPPPPKYINIELLNTYTLGPIHAIIV